VSEPLQVEVAVAKLSKYAVRESGDTVEVTERPHGGLSVVLVDGQGSGRAAKTLSNLVAKKAISLLADGTRDGAVARAVHDFLYAYRHGQVSAELAIISADLKSRTVVVSRNTHCPALLVEDGAVEQWDDASAAIGLYANTKPVIRELPIASGIAAVVYSDGIAGAGRRGGPLDTRATLDRLIREGVVAERIADSLLAAAVAADDGRPRDDMSVVVLAVRPAEAQDGARRLLMHFPLA
jgi:serine phosphatase RsbU (regulator of sigma subunit)